MSSTDAKEDGESKEEKCPPHDWSKDGERCCKCGTKDWMTQWDLSKATKTANIIG